MNNLCNECNGACCRYLCFIYSKADFISDAFYRKRNLHIITDGEQRIAFIEHECPLLISNFYGEKGFKHECKMYSSRPLACKQFKEANRICKECRKLEGLL